jgi:hypothetical protein
VEESAVVVVSAVAAAVWDTNCVIGMGVPAVQVVALPPTPWLGSPWQQISLPSWLSPKDPSVEMIEPSQRPCLAAMRLAPAKVRKRMLSCMAEKSGREGCFEYLVTNTV